MKVTARAKVEAAILSGGSTDRGWNGVAAGRVKDRKDSDLGFDWARGWESVDSRLHTGLGREVVRGKVFASLSSWVLWYILTHFLVPRAGTL